MRAVAAALLAATAAGCFWLFLTRYWFYRDCIAAAASSCITPDGDNLIAGGAIWIAPAALFLLWAAVLVLRRK